MCQLSRCMKSESTLMCSQYDFFLSLVASAVMKVSRWWISLQLITAFTSMDHVIWVVMLSVSFWAQKNSFGHGDSFWVRHKWDTLNDFSELCECEWWNDFPSTLLCSWMPRLKMLLKWNGQVVMSMKTLLFFPNHTLSHFIIFHFQGAVSLLE